MWVDYRKTKSLITAEMWKNLLEGEGLPAKIIPEGDDILDWSEYGATLEEIIDVFRKYILVDSFNPIGWIFD